MKAGQKKAVCAKAMLYVSLEYFVVWLSLWKVTKCRIAKKMATQQVRGDLKAGKWLMCNCIQSWLTCAEGKQTSLVCICIYMCAQCEGSTWALMKPSYILPCTSCGSSSGHCLCIVQWQRSQTGRSHDRPPNQSAPFTSISSPHMSFTNRAFFPSRSYIVFPGRLCALPLHKFSCACLPDWAELLSSLMSAL